MVATVCFAQELLLRRTSCFNSFETSSVAIARTRVRQGGLTMHIYKRLSFISDCIFSALFSVVYLPVAAFAGEIKPNFLRSWYKAILAAVVVSAPIAAHAMGDEEFVGPFPSWANVKTNYGAAGDGVTDDTAAIQKALNALGPTNPTLYFPDGTYRITQTLTLVAQ